MENRLKESKVPIGNYIYLFNYRRHDLFLVGGKKLILEFANGREFELFMYIIITSILSNYFIQIVTMICKY